MLETIRKYEEHEIQCSIHGWLESTYDCEVVAVPNGGYRGRLEAIRLRQEGVQAGHPDLIVYGPEAKVVLLEVKTPKGTLQPSQRQFIPRLTKLGFSTHLVRSLDDVKEIAPSWNLPPRRVPPTDAGGF